MSASAPSMSMLNALRNSSSSKKARTDRSADCVVDESRSREAASERRWRAEVEVEDGAEESEVDTGISSNGSYALADACVSPL